MAVCWWFGMLMPAIRAMFVLYASWARGGGISPKIALGEFALMSDDLPRALPQMVGQEIVAGLPAAGLKNPVAFSESSRRNSQPLAWMVLVPLR